ncbi:hypothetical protein RND71_039938 [Anisodus tanguticus]|uniref:Uncharacterized protein n=1 Tax=Anisodus tanguticus TaxID=243964 RepID=A0AAE1USF9_9SOLA|nr:hypothetical protein RND71_039938 [Anisodus tanguticus]
MTIGNIVDIESALCFHFEKEFKATAPPITTPPRPGNRTTARAADSIAAVLPPSKGSEPAT